MKSPGLGAARALTLRLFVAGRAPNSLIAIQRLRSLLDTHPGATVELQIVDVLERPELGVKAEVFVTPTLIKLAPLPERRIIGNLKDTDALLLALDLVEAEGR